MALDAIFVHPNLPPLDRSLEQNTGPWLTQAISLL
jgi:hypothetical protein